MLNFLSFNCDSNLDHKELANNETKVIFVDPDNSNLRYGTLKVEKFDDWDRYYIEVVNINDRMHDYDYKPKQIQALGVLFSKIG